MLLIDTDNALGSWWGDVDDGFAVAALLRSGLPVAGLSSVRGNASEAEADRNNRALGRLCGFPGPYLRGVEAGEVEDRVDRALHLWSGAPVRLVALGPLTNVAAALAGLERRGIEPSVPEVVLVGSNASSRGRFPPVWPHELNLTKNRAASRAVFRSDLPLTIVPLDVARRLRAGRRELAGLHGELGELLRRKSARWARRSLLLHGSAAFPVFDLVAAAYVVEPSLVEVEETTARVHRHLWIEYGKGDRPVRLVRGFDPAAVWDWLAALVTGPPGADAAAAPPGRRFPR